MMRQSYNRRKEDFKRRIIKKIYTNKKDLLIEEERWLSMIDPDKTMPKNSTNESRKNVRYYNIKLGTQNHWWSNVDASLTIGEKISASKKGKSTGPCSEETKAKIGNANRGRKFTEEHRQKLREAKLGKTLSEEHKRKIGQAGMGRVGAWAGKTFTEEHRTNISKGMTLNK